MYFTAIFREGYLHREAIEWVPGPLSPLGLHVPICEGVCVCVCVCMRGCVCVCARVRVQELIPEISSCPVTPSFGLELWPERVCFLVGEGEFPWS